MGIGKTQFNFRALGQPNLIAQFTHETLCKYGYERYIENNMIYYTRKNLNNVMYNIEVFMQGNNVSLYAYLGNKEKPKELKGMVSAANKDALKNEISTIIREINERCNQTAWDNASENERQFLRNDIMQNNEFVKQNTKSSVGYMVVCLIFSIICSISSFIGMTDKYGGSYFRIGIPFAIFIICYAVKSFKTCEKKGLIIATIIMSSIALVLSVLSFFLVITD